MVIEQTALAGLRAHPKNYNRHSEAQIGRLMKSLERFGQPKEIVIWAPTPGPSPDGEGRFIIAGHGLVEAARRLGWKALRASDMSEEWSEAQALAFMAADNELARLGDPDEAALAALVAETADFDRELAALAAGTEERLAELLGVGNGELGEVEEGQGQEGQGQALPLQRWDVPDAVWATDNDWGVPLLDAELQAKYLDVPLIAWGQGARTRKNPGTWHFYTEDYRFEALWADPSPVVNSGCVNVVEPNFSVFIDMPPAVALWHVYRKRWLARWWQGFGVRVFVDLNVAEVHADLNLLGVPQGWLAWATRGYTERMDATVREWERAVAHAGTERIVFLVYGGGKEVKKLCQARGWLWAIEQRDAARLTTDDGRQTTEVTHGEG